MLPIISALGYDTVDICAWLGQSAYPYTLGPHLRRTLPRLLESLGLKLNGVSAAGGSRHTFDRFGYATADADEYRERIAYTENCIRIAAEWGASHIQDLVGIITRASSVDEAWDRVAGAVGHLTEFAASCGIRFGLEPYMGIVNTADRYLAMKKAVPNPNLGCVVDPVSLLAELETSLEEICSKLAGECVAVHLKGLSAEGRMTQPGGPEDTLDIPGFLVDDDGRRLCRAAHLRGVSQLLSDAAQPGRLGRRCGCRRPPEVCCRGVSRQSQRHSTGREFVTSLIGLVGLGKIVQLGHMPSYQRAGLKVVAVDVGEAAVTAFRRDFSGVPRISNRVEDVLADREVGVVDIATPPSTHIALVKAAIDAGKHVMCQKPLALSLDEAREGVAYAKKAGLQLAVNQNIRYTPTNSVIAGWLREGRIGTPHLVTFEYHAPIP